MTRAAIAALFLSLACAGCYLHHERRRDVDAEVPATVSIVTIAAGDDHTCAIDDRARLWCWGFAQQGQVGDGSGDPSHCEVRITEGPITDRPVRLAASLREFVPRTIAGGATHSCVGYDVGFTCWGAGCRGQLGNGGTTGELVPRSDRGVLAFVDELWAGAFHTCLASTDGAFACWGANDRGQLGLGTTSPLSEPGATSPQLVRAVRDVRDAALGDAHTCALDASGTVWCWGANGAGQLGDGSFDVRSIPAFVRGLPTDVIDVAAGDRHSCAATDHDAWCWGWNERGQLGTGSVCAPGDEDCAERALPERVAFDGPVDEIEAGSQFTCLRSRGSVHCWGANDVGQLGNGSRGSSAAPVRVVGIEDAIAITCGANHACAILAGGRVSCWGRNAQGQLGIGAGEDAVAPMSVAFEPP